MDYNPPSDPNNESNPTGISSETACKMGSLPLISRVITPLIGVIYISQYSPSYPFARDPITPCITIVGAHLVGLVPLRLTPCFVAHWFRQDPHSTWSQQTGTSSPSRHGNLLEEHLLFLVQKHVVTTIWGVVTMQLACEETKL